MGAQLLLCLFCTLFVTSSLYAKDQLTPQNNTVTNSYAVAIEKAAPSVVSIQTARQNSIDSYHFIDDPFFLLHFFENSDLLLEYTHSQQEFQQHLGSGIIINQKGYIITNDHVIKDNSNIIVQLTDGRTAIAMHIASDFKTDLAILRIRLNNLPVCNLNFSKKNHVGDVVLAIGNPYGLKQTVTQGIISAKNSLKACSKETYNTFNAIIADFIQTDASINPGNSGGALINTYGHLIGINMAIVSHTGGSHGIGLAIPIDTAKCVLDQVIESKYIAQGWIGAYFSEITEEIRYSKNFNGRHGHYIHGTMINSPARKFGILPGDILLKINNLNVNNINNTARQVANLIPDMSYPVEIFRNGKIFTFSIVIEGRYFKNY